MDEIKRLEKALAETETLWRNERDALRYCIDTLKSHHMTRPGISMLVAQTENMVTNNTNNR